MSKKYGIGLLMLILGGCATVDEFALPEGSPENGRAAFVSLGCTACHSAAGAEHRSEVSSGVYFPLGGMTGEKSYVELVTSIINPSHRIIGREVGGGQVVGGETVSRMPVFNDVMTIRQLSDIVAYLAPQYGLAVVPFYDYSPYDYY